VSTTGCRFGFAAASKQFDFVFIFALKPSSLLFPRLEHEFQLLKKITTLSFVSMQTSLPFQVFCYIYISKHIFLHFHL